jgi:hypothetical protein
VGCESGVMEGKIRVAQEAISRCTMTRKCVFGGGAKGD